MAARFYFAGANTQSGFVNYFSDILPNTDNAKILYLRGAPGVGKSTVLKKLAAQWEKDGLNVTYYPCASDAESLDAVAAGDFCALDATQPHALFCDLPRVEGLDLDLNACLDARMLASEKRELQRLSRLMRARYQRGYRCLTAAQVALSDCAAVYAQAVDEGALCNLRLELMRFLTGGAGPCQRVFAQAVTGAGVVSHAEGMLRAGSICLDLPFGYDVSALLSPLAVMLAARGVGHVLAMDLCTGRQPAHIATDERAVVTFLEPGCDVLRLRFDASILRAEAEALAFNRAAHDLWLSRAIDAFAEAKAAHNALERIYADAVDSEKREAITEEGGRFFL